MSTCTSDVPRRPPIRMRARPRDTVSARTEPSDRTIPRRRLVARLGRAPDAHVAALVAPSGYGKSTVLAQWASTDARPWIWVGLREGHADRDPLDAVERQIAGWRSGPRAGVPVVVALDGADAVGARQARDLVALLGERLAPGSTLAIATRGEPALPLGRLRVDGRVVELRAADLAMSPAEAALLLRRAGLQLEPCHVDALVRRTEGWPAALRLAALVVGADEDAAAGIERFAGDDRLVADYLRDELLDGLSPADLDLLIRSSPLDELTGPLCDAVLEREGAGRALRSLARSNLPLVALDRAETAYRLHPLLRDLLRADLRREGVAAERALQLRASDFYRRAGDVERALRYATEAGSAKQAGELAWEVATASPGCALPPPVRRALGGLGARQVATHPALALTMATHALGDGDRDTVERWTDAADRVLAGHPSASPDRFGAATATLRAWVARDGLDRMRDDAERAYALDAPGGPWRGLALFLLGAGADLRGDHDAARAHLVAGIRAGAGEQPLAAALCRAQLALGELERGRWDEGLETADAARGAIEDAGLADEPLCALVHAVSAFACAHGDELETAGRDAEAARRLVERHRGVAPWFGAEVRVALARARLRLSDCAAARDALTAAGRAARRYPQADALRAWIDDAWGRVDAFAAGSITGPSTLTTAELRVLRMLPSHLSVPEIAARLRVSANTVKSQAHAVYRKLDASSRSEAVARARAVGLVDG